MIWHDLKANPKDKPYEYEPVLMLSQIDGRIKARTGAWNGQYWYNADADFRVEKWAYIKDIVELDGLIFNYDRIETRNI